MEIRVEFVLRALDLDANVAEQRREYGVGRKTGYKWIGGFEVSGAKPFGDVTRLHLGAGHP